MGCGFSRQEVLKSAEMTHADAFAGSQDDFYSDNMSFENALSGVKKKETYMKAEDSKICAWFREYMKQASAELPTYIMFCNRQSCTLTHLITKIKRELDKSINMVANEKKYEFFDDYTEFQTKVKQITTSIVNRLDQKEMLSNIQENNLIKKFLQTVNVNVYKNNIKPFILYKILRVKYDIYYVPLSIYGAVKTQTDIIKTIQMLELLGCKELYISSEEITQKSKQFINELNVGFITQKNGVMAKQYSEKQNHRNNSYEFIDKLFSDEDQLLLYIDLNSHIFMDHTDYETDIELRFLIRSRINSYLQEYSRSFTVKRLDSIEINTQLTVKRIYQNLGLNLKYNTDTFMEVSFKIDCVFFSLNEIIDTSSLPLDAIGFNIIKNQLFEKNTDIIKYLDTDPRVDSTVIVSSDQQKKFGKVLQIIPPTEEDPVQRYEVSLFKTNESIKTFGSNLRTFEFNDDGDNDKFLKEVRRFIQKILHYKFQRYKKHVKHSKARYLAHRQSYTSYFLELCNNSTFADLLDQVETYADVKEILCYVKFSAYFVYLNQYGFEKMRQYLLNLNDSELLQQNTNIFIRRYLYFNEVQVDDFSHFHQLEKKHLHNMSGITTFRQIDQILVSIYHDPDYCPLNMCAVNHFFTNFETFEKLHQHNYGQHCQSSSASMLPALGTLSYSQEVSMADNKLNRFIYRILKCVSSTNGTELDITDPVIAFVKEQVRRYLDTNSVSSLSYNFIENLYQTIVQKPELFVDMETPSSPEDARKSLECSPTDDVNPSNTMPSPDTKRSETVYVNDA